MSTGGGGSTSTISQQELAPEQRQLLNLVLPVAREHVNNPPTLYPDSTVAPFNPVEQLGQQQVLNAAQGPVAQYSNNALTVSSQLQGLGGSLGTAGASRLVGGLDASQPARDFMLSGALLNPNTNPVLGPATEAAIRPIANQFAQSILPGIRNTAVNDNMFGSSRQGIAEGLAGQEFLKQAGDIATNIQNNSFNQGLGAMLGSVNTATQAGTSGTGQAFNAAIQALLSAPSTVGIAFTPGEALSAVGAQQRGLTQSQLSEAANRYMTEQMLPYLSAQDVANLAYGMGGGTASTTSQNDAAGISAMQAGIGGASALSSILMGLAVAGAFA